MTQDEVERSYHAFQAALRLKPQTRPRGVSLIELFPALARYYK